MNFFGVDRLSELMQINYSAPIKVVRVDEFRMAWRILSPVLRFARIDEAEEGRDCIWCPGENCWWTTKGE